MKKALKTWYLYVIGVGLAIVVACIAIIPYFVIHDSAVWPFQYISYIFFFSAVVTFGVSFIVQDLYRARIRHKTKNWADKLPDQNLAVAWRIFLPGIVCAIICIIVGIVHSFPQVIFY